MNARHVMGLVVAIGLPWVTHGQTRPVTWCGTGPEVARRQQELHEFLSAQHPQRSLAESGMRVVDGIHVVTADASTLAFDHPFDLAQTSLRFRRADDRTFEFSRIPPAFDPDMGLFAHTFPLDDPSTFAVDLPFAFPFGRQQLSRIHVTGSNAILAAADPIPLFPQQYAVDAVSRQRAMLSPLFHPLQIGDTRVYVKTSNDSLLITWAATSDFYPMFYRIQARLYATGEVVFSYGQVANIEWGTVIATTGEEPFYADITTLAIGNDVAEDTAVNVRPELRDMLDLTSVQARRLGGTDLIEFRLQLRGAVDLSKFAPGDQVSYSIRLTNGRGLQLLLGKTTAFYSIPGMGLSQAYRIDGNVVTLRALQRFVPTGPGVRLEALTFHLTADQAIFADSAMFLANFPAPPDTAESDLGALADGTHPPKPLFEAFTLPGLDLLSIWNRIKSSTGLSDDQVDGLAVYQNFFTDIVSGPAAAFAAGGNPRVDGIAPPSWSNSYGRGQPAFPTITHMNRIGYGFNTDNRHGSFVLAHEFAHRWLYYLAISENGAVSNVLNPLSSHPAQYVHTGAAHAVASPRDASVMGGANFTDLGGGTYLSGDDETFASYSAHELYLMGLAPSDEVAPFFYLANTDPALGLSYWPPPNLRVTASRKDVTVQQIIDALGPRIPAYDGTKSYKVVYVIVERPTAPATDEDVKTVGGFAAAFERRFAVATGFRGTIQPAVEGVPLKSEFTHAPGPAVAGQPVWFLDGASGRVTAWSWSFGDGQTSSFEHPKHVYERPGTYTVTLQVSDGLAASTTAHSVVVTPKSRRRAAHP